MFPDARDIPLPTMVSKASSEDVCLVPLPTLLSTASNNFLVFVGGPNIPFITIKANINH